jgi:hypothetical protein
MRREAASSRRALPKQNALDSSLEKKSPRRATRHCTPHSAGAASWSPMPDSSAKISHDSSAGSVVCEGVT